MTFYSKQMTKIAVLGSMLALPMYAVSGTEHDMEEKADGAISEMRESGHEMKAEALDAWREGKLESAYMFNRHLNNFAIDVEVEGSTAKLTGKVESPVDKELAEQLALSIDGISDVNNELAIVPSKEARARDDDQERDFTAKVEDATLTAEVKLKLLANTQTAGTSINVDTMNKSVTLTGEVNSSAEKDLAELIANNVDGVKGVNNRLKVSNS